MSHANFNPIAVLTACESYIAKREVRIQASREEMIAERLRQFRPLRWLFGRPPVTRSEAIDELCEGDMWSEWHTVRISGGVWAGRVEDLRSLASVAISTGVSAVAVDSETISVLNGHFAA